MQITYAQISKIGDRSINEDSIRSEAADGQYCFILCDGLGGHAGGELASKCVCQVLGDAFLGMRKPVSPEDLQQLVLKSQNELLRRQQEYRISNSMRTTLCCAILSDKTALVGHVGDSRIYLFRNGRVLSRTKDHSVTQHLVSIGAISEKEIRHHEDRDRLLRVMGTEWETDQLQISEEVREIQSGDALLLCSDGFWEWIEEPEMEALCSTSPNAEAWLRQMCEMVENHGNGHEMDNYSAIAVVCDDGGIQCD